MKNRFFNKDNWETPGEIINLIRTKYGDFFDPCPLNPDFDGLNIEWKALNYVNPPYSRDLKEKFIHKAYYESLKEV